MSIERVTSGLETLGLVLLTVAAGVFVDQRFGLPAGAAVAAVLCFAWSFLIHVGLARQRQRELAERRRWAEQTGAMP